MPNAISLLFYTALLAGCAPAQKSITTLSGLQYEVLATGAGPAAEPGQSVQIHETTMLRDGTIIYDSRAQDTPITFLLGGHQVIAGVDEGVTGMRVGERRLFTIPPTLSHRSSYPPNTPPDSILVIDLELVAIDAGDI
jgi:FKBP-type peptidyl-prolyl cis-trans isomerase